MEKASPRTSNSHRRGAVCAAIAASLFFPALAAAADIAATWNGSTQDWSYAAAWGLPTYPDNNSPPNATYAVTINSGWINLSGSTPTVNALTWTGGKITAMGLTYDGTPATGGQLTVENTADLSGSLTMGGDSFVFNGTTTIGTAAATTISDYNSVPTLFNNGLITIGTHTTLNGYVNLFNAGTADITGASNSALAVLFVMNTGIVHLHSGTIGTYVGGTDTGTYLLENNATLDVGSDTLTASSSITGQGNVTAYSNVNVRGTYAISGTTSLVGPTATLTFFGPATTTGVTIINGSLAGPGSLTAAGLVSWNGGAIALAGGLTANGGVALTASSATLGGSLTVPQTASFSLGDSSRVTQLAVTAGATLTNNGLWIAGVGVIAAQGSTPSPAPQITNAGTLTIEARFSSLALEDSQPPAGDPLPLSFINTGTININGGELLLAASGHSSLGGSVVIATGATLAIAAPISLDGSISGAGNLLISNTLTDANSNAVPTATSPIVFNGSINTTGNTAIQYLPLTFAANTSLHNLNAIHTTFAGAATLTLTGNSIWNSVDLKDLSVQVNGPLSAGSNNATFTLDGASLSVAAGVTMTLGITSTVLLKNHASFTNNGLLSLPSNTPAFAFTSDQFGSADNPGGSFTNNGTLTSYGNLAFSDSITFANNGTINMMSGTLQVTSGTDTANAVITISPTASFETSRSFTAGKLNNRGALTISAGTSTVTLGSALHLTNTGTITVTTGTLVLAAPLDPISGGGFSVAADATLDLAASYNFSAFGSPFFSGAGTLIIDPNITLSLPIDSAFSGTIVDNGTLLLTAPLNPLAPTFNFTVLPAPEPASLTLLALAAPLLLRRRRKR